MVEKVWLGGIYLKEEGGYEIILKSLNHYKNRLKTLSQSPEVKDAGGTFGSILNQQARKTVPKINEVIEKIQTGLQDVQILKKIEEEKNSRIKKHILIICFLISTYNIHTSNSNLSSYQSLTICRKDHIIFFITIKISAAIARLPKLCFISRAIYTK